MTQKKRSSRHFKKRKLTIVCVHFEEMVRRVIIANIEGSIPAEHRKLFSVISRAPNAAAKNIPIGTDCVVIDFGYFKTPGQHEIAGKMINAIKKNQKDVKIILLVECGFRADVREALKRLDLERKVNHVLPYHISPESLVTRILYLLLETKSSTFA